MSDEAPTKEELLKLLNSPVMKQELSRTISNEDKPFEHGKPYPQERVRAVAQAGLQAVKRRPR